MVRRRTVRLVFQLLVLAAFVAISFMAGASQTDVGTVPTPEFKTITQKI